MAEYVLDPVAAHAIVRQVGVHANDGAEAAAGFAGDGEALLGTLGGGWIVGRLGSWLGSAGRAMSVALTRADNAVGAGHQVIDALEAADVAMAREQHQVAGQHVSDAEIHIGQGLSR